jgi:predicted acyl esterase
MIPLGAGGAVGSAAGRYSYFGLFEGGVFELASGFGWFVEHGASDPRTPLARPFDIATALRDLPVADLVRRHRPGPNGYDDFLSMPLTDPKWHDLGYLDDSDAPTVPTLEVSTWGDQTVGDTLALDESLRRKASGAAPASAPERHLIVAPGTHCHSQETGESERFGELSVKNAAQPYFEMYERWFDFWVRDRGDGLAKMPAIRYYLIGEARWLDASRWPARRATARDSPGRRRSRPRRVGWVDCAAAHHRRQRNSRGRPAARANRRSDPVRRTRRMSRVARTSWSIPRLCWMPRSVSPDRCMPS